MTKRDVVRLFAAALAVFAVVLVWTPGTHFVSDAANLIYRQIAGAPYVGYYLDLDWRDPSGLASPRLMFAAGQLPGMPTVPEITARSGGASGGVGLQLTPAVGMYWSADGERVPLYLGSRIYVGDRRGRVEQVADFGSEYQVLRAEWIGASTSEMLALLAPLDRRLQRWVSHVSVGRGPSPLRALAKHVLPHSLAFVSPDERWFGVLQSEVPAEAEADGCVGSDGLYDLVTDRLVDLVDAKGRGLQAMGWLSDGRLVTAFCSKSEHRLEIFVTPPDVVPAAPVASFPWERWTTVAWVDRPRDRVLVAPGAGLRGTELIAVSPTGAQVTIGRISAFSAAGSIAFLSTLSRDQRYLGFRVAEAAPINSAPSSLTGLIDLETGQVTEACPGVRRNGCFWLILR